MKKLFALPLAAIALAACSETELPSSPSIRSLAPSATTGVADVGESYTFELGAADDYTAFTASPIGEIPVGTSRSGSGFLGKLHNQGISLTTSNAGSYLNLDLYIEGSWDGNASGRFGGDVWTITAACTGAATKTFSTNFVNKSKGKQAYPGSLGSEYPGLTGAQDLDQLGFAPQSVKKTNVSTSAYDAVYAMSWPFPTGCTSDVTWTFSVSGIGNGEDEFWGLDNISVTAAAANTGTHQLHSW